MSKTPTIAYIFERYPVLSQTFLRREITALQELGLHVEIHALLKHDDGSNISPLENVPVEYFRKTEVFKLLWVLPLEFLRNPKLFFAGLKLWRRTKFTYAENRWSTIWAIVFALVRASQFRKNPPDIFHGVRATGAATAAALLSRLCAKPYSFGGHAYDIYRHGGDALLEKKLATAVFVHTTTETAAKYLQERAKSHPVKIVLARRGLLKLPEKNQLVHDDGKLRLLSVGRLVSKKGHERLIWACAVLNGWSIQFEARIVGDGPLREKLRDQIKKEKLQGMIKLTGSLSSEETERQYDWADIFLHTGVIDNAGDRDGLPNVIPEAMAHWLPVICSDLPELREAVDDLVTGFVANTEDPLDLANAITRIAEHPEMGQRLGANGREWVEKNFLAARNSEILAAAFREAIK